MNQRIALIVTTMVTSFILVAVGGVTATLANPTATPKPTLTSVPTLPPPTPTVIVGVDPQVMAEREAYYQQTIAQANEQLARAYKLQKVLADELIGLQPTAKPRVYVKAIVPTQPPTPSYALTPDMAATVALSQAPGATLLSTPELVSFQGTPSYEVVLDRGKIYVDANTGVVLYNGTTAPASNNGSGNNDNGGSSTVSNPAQQPSSGGDDGGQHEQSDDHHEDDGHEGGG